LNDLVKDVLAWPHIESIPSFVNRHIVWVRLEKKAARIDAATFISDREFARFLLAAPTIYLALPLPLARRAIARRWGRASLPSIFRINAYAQESGGTRGLLFAFLRSLPICLQVRQEKLNNETLAGLAGDYGKGAS